MRDLIRKAEAHDANEERRYLYEGRRWHVCWSWVWLAPSLSIGANYYPSDPEDMGAFVVLGPLSFEVYRRRFDA